MTRLIAIVVVMGLSILGCDSAMVPADEPPEPTPKTCREPDYEENEFALRFINETEFEIDSVTVFLNPEDWFAEDFRSKYPLQHGEEPYCYDVLPRTYRHPSFPGAIRDYKYFYVSPGWGQFPSTIEEIRFESAKYTYHFRLESYTELRIHRDGVFLRPEDFEGPDVKIRLLNYSSIDLTDIRIHYPDTVIHVPELPYQTRSEYFTVPRAYRYAYTTLWAGDDFLEWIPIDYVGESFVPNGHYNLRLDTLHVTKYSNISDVIKDD